MDKAIIFDLDGTLWDSTEGVTHSWLTALEHLGITNGVTKDQLRSVMGMTMVEIEEKLLPNLDEREKDKVFDTCIAYENQYLEKNPGRLFEGLEDALKVLSKKYDLYIVSNCQSGYIEAFAIGTGLGHYFKGWLCWGDTHQRKGFTIKKLLKDFQIGKAIYVGDTSNDEMEARYAGLPFVHAAYGFGQAINPEASIRSISELPSVAEEIFKK